MDVFYLVAICIGFFGGFFAGYGLSGPLPEESRPIASQSGPETQAREQELLRQLAQSQSNCAAQSAQQAAASQRSPASVAPQQEEEASNEPYRYEANEEPEESSGWRYHPLNSYPIEEEP